VTVSKFVVPLTTLLRAQGSRRREQIAEPMSGLVVADVAVASDVPVSLDVWLVSAKSAITVDGDVEATWVAECRRCLTEVRGQIGSEVHELLRPAAAIADDSDEESYPYTGEEADLAPIARDAMLLLLPLAPLCKPTCMGLCPNCGVDRNTTTCDCQPDARDPRWAALDALIAEQLTDSGEQ